MSTTKTPRKRTHCIRCGKELTGAQRKYCSKACCIQMREINRKDSKFI